MSIKAPTGIPITPQPFPVANAAAVFMTHDSLTIANVGGNTEVAIAMANVSASLSTTITSDSLDFPTATQERDQWCWAACTRMVLHTLGQPDVPQCEIATTLLEEDCCAASCDTDCCNTGASEDEVLTVYEAFGVEADFHDDIVTFNRLRQEITENRSPVEVAIDWEGDNGGHLIVIRGWSRNQNVRRVKIRDPYYRDGEIRYSDLLNYKDGRWIFTWTGFRSIGE